MRDDTDAAQPAKTAEQIAADVALVKFRAFLDQNPEIGLAWVQDRGDTLMREMRSRYAATKRGREQQPLRTFSAWCAAQPDQDNLLPEDHAVFRWADSVGLPEYYVFLAWCWFRRAYGPEGRSSAKKYRDWLAVFDDSVRNRWANLWYPHGNGFRLSADGEILAREFPESER
jgi:hypothetical protein